MKTNVLILSSLILGGLLFSSCQKDNALIEETSFEQVAAAQDEADSPKTGPWGGSNDLGNLTDDLINNFPDPFTRTTTIQYYLKKASWVTLKVRADYMHQPIVLVNGYQGAGQQQAKFDASDLPYGKYIASLQVGNEIYTEVMTKRPPFHKKDNSPVSEH